MTAKTVKQILIFIIGLSVILFGVLLLVLPGPGLVTIAVGLAILATEFAWAKRLLGKMKEQAREEADKLMDRMQGNGRTKQKKTGTYHDQWP